MALQFLPLELSLLIQRTDRYDVVVAISESCKSDVNVLAVNDDRPCGSQNFQVQVHPAVKPRRSMVELGMQPEVVVDGSQG